MNRYFNADSPIMRFLSRISDIMLLNILFILTSIPVITIGPSLTALYYTTQKMTEHKETYLIKDYLKSFKENFRQAVIMWIICLLFVLVVLIDFRIFSDTNTASMVEILLISSLLLFLFVFEHLFAFCARFYSSIKDNFITAFVISIRYFPQTLLCIGMDIVFLTIVFVMESVFHYGVILCLGFGFALPAFIKSIFLVKLYNYCIPAKDTPEE